MSKRREPLPRLSIGPNLAMQQPVGGQAMFSPAMPTSLQQTFHPAIPMSASLQTPMQSFFNPHPPAAPGRPTHHPHQASIQLAAAGIHPPNLITPVATHFSRPSMMLGPNSQPHVPSHPFPGRNRRQLSIGGPPKAVLGGPARKLSPLPAAAATPGAPATSSTPAPKAKKVIVNLPKETVLGDDGQPPTRPSWARSPRKDDSITADQSVAPPELMTAESYPSDAARLVLPDTIDVYLPGKAAWDSLKKVEIEEKLERLGVERGSGSNVPHIHAPHARAASISSPADPALLLFKLNKLHQAQETSLDNSSLSVSPQPPFAAPFGLSPSPHHAGRFGNRHGHTMSLAHAPSYQSSLFSSSPAPYNPSGFGSETSVELEEPLRSHGAIHAPQGRVPIPASNYTAPPLSAVGNNNQIDFARGFGLDVPLESEEEGEDDQATNGSPDTEGDIDGDATQDMELEDLSDREVAELDDGTATAPQSRLHSRHVSKLSAALSLRAVGGNHLTDFPRGEEEAQEYHEQDIPESPKAVDAQNAELEAQVAEWTGSEDIYLGTETSDDDESIGEWSNPSDEERARQQRVDRRSRRRAVQQQLDQPRRIPDFPRPPENTRVFRPRPEDDIISNPSEEEHFLQSRRAEFLGVSTEEYFPDSPSNLGTSSPRFMPLPHSRVTSGQFSTHGPHSRSASDHYGFSSGPFHQSQPSFGRRDSLNPFAKPFVFGAGRDSGSFPQLSGQSSPSLPGVPSMTHSRLPSLGKPLNISAPEFKPGSFNFRLPGAPQMPAPPEFPRPQAPIPPPLPPVADSATSSPFKVQGREKRQRRGSTASLEEGDSMHSFRFPMKPDSPQNIRRTGSFSDVLHNKHNSSVTSFTFAGFNAIASNMPLVPTESDALEQEMKMPEPEGVNVEESVNDSSTAKGERSEDRIEPATVPTQSKPKRAPIPLDFKHPASGNTVPAGLFKALVNNGEERTRRVVRSRLSSREIFEHMHRPSMDDTHVASIASRTRLGQSPAQTPARDDVFGSVVHSRRRSSLPEALRDNESSASEEMSVAPQDLTTRFEIQHVENVISQLLDDKLAPLRQELSNRQQNGEQKLSSSTEAMMADVISLFRTQLHDSATRSLQDSQMDARGELDFQMIKDVIEESHNDLLSRFQHELRQVVQQLPSDHSQELMPVVERVGNRTIDAVVEAISELSARQEAVAVNAPAWERDLIVDKLVTVLSPMLHSIRPDPIDYEFLTRELTQAVKPHISQLIDLASDKRETASLIVDRILPLLPSSENGSIDTDAITLKLITEVRRAIAPIDAFEIKEQVADLVVERLDSRLAVRDKQLNADVFSTKVTENVSTLLEPLRSVPETLEQLTSSQQVFIEKQNEFVISQSQIAATLAALPENVSSQLESLKAGQNDILTKLDQPTPAPSGPDEDVLLVKDTVEILSTGQLQLIDLTSELLSQNKTSLSKVDELPQIISGITNNLENTILEALNSKETVIREMEELRKHNTELQIQLTKARSNHGQVRVEKDVLNEKFSILEGDQDRLRNQVKELQASASDKAKEASALEARNAQLDESIATALARLQASDVATEAHQRRITELETSNQELLAQKQQLTSKVDSLQSEVSYATRDKEAAGKALDALQKQHDHILLQQGNWDVLTSASEKINMVLNHLENADNNEIKELREHRDRSKALEGDNATLQKRVKDLETKVANTDKAATTTRQTLIQAQQRSTEWERRAKEYEGNLELVQTQLEQAEQTQAQLDADYSLVKLQLEEREADSRLVQDRENKLRDQITALESKCALLQSELEKARTTRVPAMTTSTPHKPFTNGSTHPPPRPDSRASTIDGRADNSHRVSPYSTTQRGVASTQPTASVWDSMHAPTNVNGSSRYSKTSIHAPGRASSYVPSTPKPQRSTSTYHQYQRRAPSPTPSTISMAPTQGDDGWWSLPHSE